MIPGKESLLKETVPELIKIHHKFEVYELPKPIVDVDSIFRTAFLPESIKAINQNNKETDENLVESLIEFPLPPIFRDEDDTNELQISRRQKR
ncbi:hypothetical protein TVAG_474850 [Trichomonas vaginalis G3]|uniref:Uncharacterized protein n=1 Tax=Trichomonas vaginalis (strain ATCC PRA-98 / G3) TaxID=412133 RepID=A2ERN5_TRIV3|nr:hypothetical protein TVAGG3_0344900 [Trichomonas vaginalis G3]EAY04687.1 hypothetical protein TVAG_474850 [Trichomonas vaginalis G3]KAI5530903.1 hypothetical protein TVAGG3_0344900 [Trichomonas vaginalis G3]|eukprot:XP_001316910.1 hypothetical protein [Trichomonas vaginalis G3]